MRKDSLKCILPGHPLIDQRAHKLSFAVAGIYYTRITDNLIVGSQPQTPEDVERLFHQEGITAIVNLQQDHDIAYWQVDLSPIRKRCEELGVVHIRRPARDFDPHSLRQELPRMVAAIDKLTCEGRNVYVHCTAGLGRAPGCAIAYLFWFQHMTVSFPAQ